MCQIITVYKCYKWCIFCALKPNIPKNYLKQQGDVYFSLLINVCVKVTSSSKDCRLFFLISSNSLKKMNHRIFIQMYLFLLCEPLTHHRCQTGEVCYHIQPVCDRLELMTCHSSRDYTNFVNMMSSKLQNSPHLSTRLTYSSSTPSLFFSSFCLSFKCYCFIVRRKTVIRNSQDRGTHTLSIYITVIKSDTLDSLREPQLDAYLKPLKTWEYVILVLLCLRVCA